MSAAHEPVSLQTLFFPSTSQVTSVGADGKTNIILRPKYVEKVNYVRRMMMGYAKLGGSSTNNMVICMFVFAGNDFYTFKLVSSFGARNLLSHFFYFIYIFSFFSNKIMLVCGTIF